MLIALKFSVYENNQFYFWITKNLNYPKDSFVAHHLRFHQTIGEFCERSSSFFSKTALIYIYIFSSFCLWHWCKILPFNVLDKSF